MKYSVNLFLILFLTMALFMLSCTGSGSYYGVYKPKIINWSGYNWKIKSAVASPVGPGNNYFSDENVRIDDNGFLHLKISKKYGKYFCSEISTEENFGYGTFIFYASGRKDMFDKNVVLGMFTWNNENCVSNANSELDIEVSKWTENIETSYIQYVVQPDNDGLEKERLHRIPLYIYGDYTMHIIKWHKDSVSFSSYHGHTYPPPASNLISEWTFDKGNPPKSKLDCSSNPVVIPEPGNNTKININLWLINGMPPSDDIEPEVIINKVEYFPENY